MPRPKYVMPPPNDDAEAYGWTLGKLRHPAVNDNNKIDPSEQGRHVFTVPTPYTVRQVYGHNIDFLNPAFLQLMLDHIPAVAAATEKTKEAGYTVESLQNLERVIQRAFKESILPDIEARFAEIVPIVARFYAARLAHITKFGSET